MKLVLVLILVAIATLCAGVPTPVELPEALTPVELSEAPTPVKFVDAPIDANDIKGDRCKWIPDDNGEMHLVDLQHKLSEEELEQITRNANNNQYRLFTRANPGNHQVIVSGNAGTISSSNYHASRPLVVIVHGWNNNGNSAVNIMVRDAFLAVLDCNVIVVDWSHSSQGLYGPAMGAVPAVGQHIGQFVTWLLNTGGGNWNNVHFVGFSLGAHAVGNAGRATGNRPRRVTGLDPAGPGWNTNGNALSANDGQYVECIHTDGNIAGIMNPICRANFYPNGGQNCQPGCNCNPACSHGRSYEFFASTVRHNHLIGRRCNNIWEANLQSCNGATVHMGNAILTKNADGLFGLQTGSGWPF